MIHNVTIIGSGPAGLTAAIYGARGQLAPLVFEGDLPGGQLMTTTAVENWPGDISVMGPQLMVRMQEHAKAYGAILKQEKIAKVDLTASPYTVTTEGNQTYQTHAIIIATGSAHKKLCVPGEQEYWGKGVTTCATCDGPFYRDKEVVIAGGGNSAMTEAAFLTKFCKKVTVVQILDHITANDPIKESVINHEKVEILLSHKITEIRGEHGQVTEVVIEGQTDHQTRTIPASGVFIAIGFSPNTGIVAGQLDMDDYGYIIRHDHTKTSKPGVFACGDVSDFRYQQAVTAAGEGCMAALDCEKYLRKTLQNDQ